MFLTLCLCSFDELACLGLSGSLCELTLDGNPVAQESCYKQAPLHCVLPLRLLDMKRISVSVYSYFWGPVSLFRFLRISFINSSSVLLKEVKKKYFFERTPLSQTPKTCLKSKFGFCSRDATNATWNISQPTQTAPSSSLKCQCGLRLCKTYRGWNTFI